MFQFQNAVVPKVRMNSHIPLCPSSQKKMAEGHRRQTKWIQKDWHRRWHFPLLNPILLLSFPLISRKGWREHLPRLRRSASWHEISMCLFGTLHTLSRLQTLNGKKRGEAVQIPVINAPVPNTFLEQSLSKIPI